MASDSRQSIVIQRNGSSDRTNQSFETINSDSVYKTFLLEHQNVGISSFGDYLLQGVSLESQLRDFSNTYLDESDDVCSVASKLQKFCRQRSPEANTSFHVAGFKREAKTTEAFVYNYSISRNSLNRINERPAGEKRLAYGAAWGGRVDVLSAMLGHGPSSDGGAARANLHIPIIWDAMAPQDAVDFAIFAVRTTIECVRFQARSKDVGGPIDVLVLKPEETLWIQRKELQGAAGYRMCNQPVLM